MVNKLSKTKSRCCYCSNQNCMHCYGSGIIEIKYIEHTNTNLLEHTKNTSQNESKISKNTVTIGINNLKAIRNQINNVVECTKCKLQLTTTNINYINDKEAYCNYCIKEKTKHLRKCLCCNKFISKNYLDKHFEEVHNYVKCKYCKLSVINMQKYLLEKKYSVEKSQSLKVDANINHKNNTYTNIPVTKPNYVEQKEHSSKENKLVDCKHCNYKVIKNRLDKHKKKVHNNHNQLTKQYSKKRIRTLQNNKNNNYENKQLYELENNLEKLYNYQQK